MRFAFYGRVSTEDAQDPEASLGWQLRRSNALIEPAGGAIVAQFFDVGQSRSVPWPRRPEASRLLQSLKDDQRGFSAVVIGEPQRAFYGNQFSLTFPVLTHYGVQLWVPEVGGAVDPGSEAHDMVMTLFGGMSKSERARTQIRVKAAMSDLAQRTDRFLGGRPPYGYRLVDAGPHPNPSKATAGQRLHRLEPDPVTAPVVERIYTMFAMEERGLRAIAEALTAEHIASPAAYDPARNPHRSPLGWSHSAVRAILANPTYTGIRTWAKQGRTETLIDPDDPAAGFRTRMRWHARDEWITPDHQTHEPLVSEELATLVNGRLVSTNPSQPKPRSSPHPYCLRGLLYCARCGSRMQGSWRPARSDGAGRVLYRCEIRRGRALPAELADHPSTLYVREGAILAHLDPWIESFSDPAWLAQSQLEDPHQSAKLAGQRAELAQLDRKIDNLMAAIEDGGDARMLMDQLAKRQTQRQALSVRLSATPTPRTPDPAQISAILTELGGLSAVLRTADPSARASAYNTLGLHMVYDDRTHQVRVTADLARVAKCVGGGT
ncbi:MAG: recombinase family protein [Acidimicrobiales bacterium]